MKAILFISFILATGVHADTYHCHGMMLEDIRVDVRGEYPVAGVKTGRSHLTLMYISGSTQRLMSDQMMEVSAKTSPSGRLNMSMKATRGQERVTIVWEPNSERPPEVTYMDAGNTTPLDHAICEVSVSAR